MKVVVFHFNEIVRTILGVSKIEQIVVDGKLNFVITLARLSLDAPTAILYPCDEHSLVLL